MRGVRWRRARVAVSVAAEVALVVAVLVVSWAGTGNADVTPGPRVVVFLAMVPGILVLPWRRRWPSIALVVALAPAVLGWLVLGSPENLGSVLPPAVLLFAVGRHEPNRRLALLLVAVSPLLLFVHEWRDPQNTSWHALLLALPYDAVVPAAWLLGAFLRVRSEQDASRSEQIAVAERTRIARELHDIVAHGLAVMVVQAEGAAEVLEQDPARARAALERVAHTGRSSLVDLRRALGVLRSGDASHEPLPGLDGIDELVRTVRESGVRVDREVSGELRPLAPAVDLALYRVVQEALTNTMRHADAARALVRIEHRPDSVRVAVIDDGRATPSGRESGGGLLGIRERIAMLGGEVELGPGTDGGFRVIASVPLEPA